MFQQLRLLAALTLTALTATAHAESFELAFTSEALAHVSDTTSATSTDALHYTPGLRFGWRPVEHITALIGWRSVSAMTRADRGYDLTTSGDALIVGARYSLGVHPIFDVHFELELEALHTDFALEVGGQRGETSAWSFGAIPKVVASARAELGVLVLDVRLFGGFAARTNQRADGLKLASAAPRSQVAPIDLGSLNLSGAVFGVELALLF